MPSARMVASASSSAVAQSTDSIRRVHERRLAPLAPAFELAMEREAVGLNQQRVVDVAQPVEGHARGHPRGDARRRLRRHRRAVLLLRLQRRVRRLQHVEMLLDQRRRHVGGDRALLDQDARPVLAHGRVRGHRLVRDGLRERRLVAFVVAVAAVADEIDQEIETEARAILPRQPGGLEARDRIVGVDVHDRDLESAGEAARVAGAVRLLGRGGEPELVVRDDVDRPAGVVAGQPRQVQRFRDHALPGKRRVAVNEDRQRDPAVEARRAPAVRRGAGGPRHARPPRDRRLRGGWDSAPA